MAMRLATFSLILAAAAATASAAAAQMMGQMSGQMGQMGAGSMMSSAPPNSGIDEARFPTAQQRYAAKIMALKQKMAKLTQQDGGQLSDAHKASLQRELDGVNKSFGIKPAHG
jgi:hypothetical protein